MICPLCGETRFSVESDDAVVCNNCKNKFHLKYDVSVSLIPAKDEACTPLDYFVLDESESAIVRVKDEYKPKLVSATIPPTISALKNMSFAGCLRLREVYIPKTVLTLECRIFEGCANLDTIYCEGDGSNCNSYYSWRSGCPAKVVWNFKREV